MSNNSKFLTYTLKHMIWSFFTRHIPNNYPNICIFTSRRSGATWLSKVISSEKGVKFITEPFANGVKDPLIKHLYPREVRDATIPFCGIHDNWMKQFNTRIFDGSLNLQQPWNPFKHNF